MGDMDEMRDTRLEYPDAIHCHDAEYRYQDCPTDTWEACGAHARACSYCGSLHPADLVEWLERRGMELEGADWKYGWAHKFYLRNGPPRTIKFYNVHLKDLPPATFAYVAALIAQRTGIQFHLEDRKLFHYAPPRRTY